MHNDMPNHPSPKTGERTFLGFDYGVRRIGVALGQELTKQASGLTTLTSVQQKPDWQSIGQLIEEWTPDALIVGIPVHMDGKEHEITQKAKKFCRQLEGRYNLPVYQVDERLSSVEAEAQLSRQKKPGKQNRYTKAKIDETAAKIILQSWLESLSTQQSGNMTQDFTNGQ